MKGTNSANTLPLSLHEGDFPYDTKIIVDFYISLVSEVQASWATHSSDLLACLSINLV